MEEVKDGKFVILPVEDEMELSRRLTPARPWSGLSICTSSLDTREEGGSAVAIQTILLLNL